MNEIIKIFTKYDRIYKQINVPKMVTIQPIPLNDKTDISQSFETRMSIPYYPMELEEGLEGIRFVHYKRGIIAN